MRGKATSMKEKRIKYKALRVRSNFVQSKAAAGSGSHARDIRQSKTVWKNPSGGGRGGLVMLKSCSHMKNKGVRENIRGNARRREARNPDLQKGGRQWMYSKKIFLISLIKLGN